MATGWSRIAARLFRVCQDSSEQVSMTSQYAQPRKGTSSLQLHTSLLHLQSRAIAQATHAHPQTGRCRAPPHLRMRSMTLTHTPFSGPSPRSSTNCRALRLQGTSGHELCPLPHMSYSCSASYARRTKRITAWRVMQKHKMPRGCSLRGQVAVSWAARCTREKAGRSSYPF